MMYILVEDYGPYDGGYEIVRAYSKKEDAEAAAEFLMEDGVRYGIEFCVIETELCC